MLQEYGLARGIHRHQTLSDELCFAMEFGPRQTDAFSLAFAEERIRDTLCLRLRSPFEQVDECDRAWAYTELWIRATDCQAAHANNR